MQYSRKMALADRWNRIPLGTPAEMTIFAQTLKAFRQACWVQTRTMNIVVYYTMLTNILNKAATHLAHSLDLDTAEIARILKQSNASMISH